MVAIYSTTFANLEESKEILEKKKKLNRLISGSSKSWKERDKHRTRLSNINKIPFQNKQQESKLKKVKAKERASRAKHREMYS